MNLFDYLKLGNIVLPLNGGNLGEAYGNLVNFSKEKPVLKEADRILNELINREKEFSFRIDAGIYLPHIRLRRIQDFSLIIGLSKEGVKIKESKEKGYLFFFEVAPIDEADKHILLLREIAVLSKKISIKILVSTVMTSADLYSKLWEEYQAK